MAAQQSGIVITNLAAFRADLKAAQGKYPRDLVVALKKAGQPAITRAASTMPSVSGLLRGSLKTSVRGVRGEIVSSAPYGGGAEWGQFGKWTGWVNKHGAPPRFVWPAVEAAQEEIAQVLAEGLKEVITARGWFH